MASGFQITIDCADPERQARFWALALGYQLEPPPDGMEHFGVVMSDPEGNEFCVH